jgi:hypothetical protein
MAAKLNILDTPEVQRFEAMLADAEAEIAKYKALHAHARSSLAAVLRQAEKETGKPQRAPNWVLSRSQTTTKRTVLISLLRKYVTDEIIGRCTTTSRTKVPELIKNVKRKST